MQGRRIARFLVHAALLVLILAVAAFNVMNLMEAYGGGPPYYARSTNMDKWTNPLPLLGVVDAMTIVVATVLLWLSRRLRRQGPDQ